MDRRRFVETATIGAGVALVGLAASTPARAQALKTTNTPIVMDLGVTSVSTPWLDLKAELNDGSSPGRSRNIFTGIKANWIRKNSGGQFHKMVDLQVEGGSFFQIIPNTTDRGLSENGGNGDILRFLNRADSTKNWGIEYAGNGYATFKQNNVGFLRVSSDGGPADVNGFPALTLIDGYGTNRLMIDAVNGALVLACKTGHMEFESAGTAVEIVPYLRSTSLGCDLYFHNEGQTGAVSTPLGAYSISGTIPAFSWGSQAAGITKKGHLNSDGSIFIGNTSEPPSPIGGGILYVEDGALRYKGSSGTVTTIALA